METKITWLPQDAVNLRDFIATETGKKFLEFLRSAVKMGESPDIQTEALNWRTYKGGMQVLAMVDLCLKDPPKQTQGNMPTFHNVADAVSSGRSAIKE